MANHYIQLPTDFNQQLTTYFNQVHEDELGVQLRRLIRLGSLHYSTVNGTDNGQPFVIHVFTWK